MSLLDEVLGAGGGSAVNQLARQFGLDESQAQAAISALLPAVAQGFRKNAASEDGLNGLMGALSGGAHQKYVDDPASLASPETVQDGNGILGHIFGSKDVSRAVTSQAAQQTGIGGDVLKQMLPVVAAMAMGAMSRGRSTSVSASGGVLDMLSGMLDQNKDGSAVDDIMRMASKFLQK
jgi:hypothetical protein